MARKAIPEATQVSIFLKSRRRCCLCFGLRGGDEVKKGQLAHLDGDNENFAEDNLAFLCFDHHDEYDSTTRLSKGLREQEVRRWRDELYKRNASQIAGESANATVTSLFNPLHRMIDLLTNYHSALGLVHQANTNEIRLTSLDKWRSCHPAVWESSSVRDDTIRRLADPAKEWLSQIRCPYVRAEDFNLVEEAACVLSGFAVSPLPMSMPEIYSKAYTTEDELWQRWGRQGEEYVALGGLVARLKELAARAGQKWSPSPQL